MLHHFDMLSAEIGIATSKNLKSVILGLGTYFFLLMRCQKKVQDAPRNEEAEHFKSKMMCCAYDHTERVFGCVTWGKGKL